MSCKSINELLSAYLDGELTPQERWSVEAHLDRCGRCCTELEGLRQTKRLVGALSRQRPREELEALLLQEAARAEREADSLAGLLRRLGNTPLSPRPLLATVALSLAGLWAFTSRLPESPPDAGRGLPAATVIGQVPMVNTRGDVVGSYLLVSNPAPTPPPNRPFIGLRLSSPPPLLESGSPLLSTASWRSESLPQGYRSPSAPLFAVGR